MSVILRSVVDIPEAVSKVFVVSDLAMLKDFQFIEAELAYAQRKQESDCATDFIVFNRLDSLAFVLIPDQTLPGNELTEKFRRHGASINKVLVDEKYQSVALIDLIDAGSLTLAIAEGLSLSSYRFEKYKTNSDIPSSLDVMVVSPAVSGCELAALNRLNEAVFLARDLVNEPVGYLTAERLGEIILEEGARLGFSAEVFNKKKIESLKMGGLLAVNQGSVDPPTFSVLEWKPENAVNSRPYVLVGKGVVFDTGGINLKTPPGSLDTMKCDMSGAASVVGAFAAIVANNLPVHVIGLVPATDNRPGGNAIVPGDILTMHNGTTVEIINTDAEGRLILADALSFAKRYEPELVIDLATLTGSAVMAIGSHGMVGMGTAGEEMKTKLWEAGELTGERVVWFPFWSDYDDEIKSEVADIKNLGGREAGAITAGKFLSRFIDSPWIHLDIAGPAFLSARTNYRGIGGTGVGVRLLYRFFESLAVSAEAEKTK